MDAEDLAPTGFRSPDCPAHSESMENMEKNLAQMFFHCGEMGMQNVKVLKD
jgi:hypothetical protein